MNNKLLLPRSCRLAGYIILPFAITLLIAVYHFEFSFSFLHYNEIKGKQNSSWGGPGFLFSKDFYADYTGTVAMLITFACLFMAAFSRLKHEDEYVAYIRLRALQLSVYVNYIILVVTSLLFFGFTFLMVMEINLFTILILFILIFNYNLYIKPRLSNNGTI
jgi:hypothetical protein